MNEGLEKTIVYFTDSRPKTKPDWLEHLKRNINNVFMQ